MNKTLIAVLAGVLLGVVGTTFLLMPTSIPLKHVSGEVTFGGTVAKTVTADSTTVSGATSTRIIAAGENLQRLILQNTGAGTVWCSFGATTTAPAIPGFGLGIDPHNTTSTLQERDIADPSLLGKGMQCVGMGVTTTLAVLKYSY